MPASTIASVQSPQLLQSALRGKIIKASPILPQSKTVDPLETAPDAKRGRRRVRAPDAAVREEPCGWPSGGVEPSADNRAATFPRGPPARAPLLAYCGRPSCDRRAPACPRISILPASECVPPAARSPSPNPQTANAQQRRRHKALMRHTAARCFPFEGKRTSTTLRRHHDAQHRGVLPSPRALPAPDS